MNPGLEQCHGKVVEEGNHGTLLLDGDPVCLMKQGQSRRAGFLGEGAVDQLIELFRRPALTVALTAAMEQHMEKVLGIRIPGRPHTQRGMYKLGHANHITNRDFKD